MKKLLIVDDEPDVCETIRRELINEGFDVSSANNGADALVKTAEQHFDLVLLDMLMPGMNGIQVIQVLRKWAPDLPIVGLTGYIGEGYMAEASLYGVVCLSKPIETHVLVNEINEALTNQAAKHKKIK